MLINLGILALGASGSAGGITASRNRSGFYLRARTKPVNPNSGRQMFARALLQFVAEAWTGTLTQVQRDAWDQYADIIPWKNSLGLDIKLTGFNHFLRANTVRLNATLSVVPGGPTILTLPEADPTFAAIVGEALQDISVAFDNTLAWANETGGAMLVSMSSPKNSGRTFIGPPFRVAGFILGDDTVPPTSPQLISTPFIVAADQKVDVIARIIRLDGRVSTPFRVTVSVIA